jgi:hypothetical protein
LQCFLNLRVLDEAAANELDGEHPEQRDVRIGGEEILRRRYVERLRDGEPALDPGACHLRSALEMVPRRARSTRPA